MTSTHFTSEIISHNLQIFLKPVLGYGDVIYDHPHKEFFCEKLEPT